MDPMPQDERRASEPDETAAEETAVEETAVDVTVAEPRPWKWFRVSVLLGILLVVASIAPRVQTERVVLHAQATPPPVVEPTGELKEVFDFARPATLVIETRCRGGRGGALGVGTGFFISAEGQVLSAYHVVDATNPPCRIEYVAVTPERAEYPLELLAFDAFFDVAPLQADVSMEVPYLPIAVRHPSPGDRIVAIRNS
jgi:hypothetical protein